MPDLDLDIRETFDPRKNAGLEYSDIRPFVAYDEKGLCVGRIAGIINHRANEKWQTRNVRFGLIEFTDDPDVSEALLKAVEAWGREHGMTHIQGPMGIFDFDKEGMLVEDFWRRWATGKRWTGCRCASTCHGRCQPNMPAWHGSRRRCSA